MVRFIALLLVFGHAYMAMSESDGHADDDLASSETRRLNKYYTHHNSSDEVMTDAEPPQEDGTMVSSAPPPPVPEGTAGASAPPPPVPEGTSGAGYSIEDMLGAKEAPAPAAESSSSESSDPADSMLSDTSGEHSETSEDPMAALLRGDVGTVGSDEEHEDEDEGFSMKHVDMGESSKEIVEGVVDSFMHKVALESGEKQCLADSLGSFVGDITALGRDAVNAFKGFMKPNGQGGMHASSTGVAGLMPLAMDGITRITDLVSVSTSLVKKCVQGDALKMLNQTAHNLVNFTYIERRLIVNGVNIAEAIAQSIIDFEHHKFYDFGSQIGLALRKVALSTATNGIKLPEGMPEDEIIADASEGIVNGFFAEGVHFVVKDKADPDVDIDIDLHDCIAGNHLFYREIWESLWTLFAQLAVNKGQHDGTEGPPVWQNELLMAVMRLPMAFTKCGVDAEMETMMVDAFKTFKELSVTFTFPDDKIKADTATEKVALAVEYFTKWKFFKFGRELGKLFRELLLLALPKKYSVDNEGRLRRNLLGEAEVFKAANLLHVSNEGRATLVMGSLALVLLMSLVAVRRLRLPWQQANSPFMDVEAGEDQELELLE